MMKDVELGLLSKIIVYRLDRISRSISDFSKIMEFLQKYDVSFVSATEKFDTSTSMGRAMLYVVMIFAQLERETIAERVKDNYYSRNKNGNWPSGPAPFGFKLKRISHNGKQVTTIEPTEDIELIKRIYKEYSESNASLGSIARGIREGTGEMWNNIKLSRILHNPSYVKADADVYNYFMGLKCILVNDVSEFTGEKGCNLYGKRDKNANKYRNLEENVLALGLHDGIIDSATWLACQGKLSKNVQIKNTGKGKHTWLSGYLKCGYCGYSLAVRSRYDKTKYLNCTGRNAKDGACAEKFDTIRINDIESYVSDAIIEVLKAFATAQQAPITQEPAENISKANELKIKLTTIDQQIKALIDNLTQANSVLIDYINEKIMTLHSDREEILTALNKITTSATPINMPTPEEWLTFDMETKKVICNELLDKVYITNDEIKIAWKA